MVGVWSDTKINPFQVNVSFPHHLKNLILHTGVIKVKNMVSKIKRTIEDNCYECHYE